jgi:hypothetical protein
LQRGSNRVRRAVRLTAIVSGMGLVLALAATAFANVQIQVVSNDPYTNASSYHRTEVEADTFSFGNTIVATFQTGRFNDGGASNVGWATSINGGQAWQHGFLPGTTQYANPPGPFRRATDPAVTYDAMHDVWMIVTLDSLASTGFNGDAILASRSVDGGLTFKKPVHIKDASGFQGWDKSWINCDNTPSSPYYGHCYAEWDDFGGGGNQLHMSRSTDGGLTWQEGTVPGGSIVIGGMPVSQPNGTVVVPIDDGFTSSAEAFISRNGGQSFTGPFAISPINAHTPAGGVRSLDLISADVDAAGRIYVAWYDCRFRSGCSSNDLVMSTSTNGRNWTPVVRIPIDPTGSTVDHFLPGIAVDPSTSGGSAHLGLVYNFYPKANCSSSTCKLMVGFIESADGGATWAPAVTLSGPMTLTWLPFTTQGYMAGDYNSLSFIGNNVRTVYALAQQGTCQLGQITSCKVSMVSPRQPLIGAGRFTPAGRDRPVPGWRPDRPGALKSAH